MLVGSEELKGPGNAGESEIITFPRDFLSS